MCIPAAYGRVIVRGVVRARGSGVAALVALTISVAVAQGVIGPARRPAARRTLPTSASALAG